MATRVVSTRRGYGPLRAHGSSQSIHAQLDGSTAVEIATGISPAHVTSWTHMAAGCIDLPSTKLPERTAPWLVSSRPSDAGAMKSDAPQHG